MNRVIYVLLLIGVLLIFLYVQSQYNIDGEQLEKFLSEYINEDITITQQVPLLQTKSTVYLIESSLTKGYAISTKHRLVDKWKIEALEKDVNEAKAQIITTNRGNYIVASGEEYRNQVMMSDGKVYEMELFNQEIPIFISKSTVAKKYQTFHIKGLK